jgi:hypothetical protein
MLQNRNEMTISHFGFEDFERVFEKSEQQLIDCRSVPSGSKGRERMSL